MVDKQVFLYRGLGRWGGGTGTFAIKFFQGLSSFSFRNYSLQNCVMHFKKIYFFCHHNFMKKRHP